MTRREPIEGAERRALMEACLIEGQFRDVASLAREATSDLFGAISKKLGRETALNIFASFNKSPSELKLIKNKALLDRYDIAPPSLLKLANKPDDRPNLKQLAREIAKENEKLPQEERAGPTGSTDPDTIEKQIYRLVQERDKDRERAKAEIARRRAKLGLPKEPD
jgi:hypothetical protein